MWHKKQIISILVLALGFGATAFGAKLASIPEKTTIKIRNKP